MIRGNERIHKWWNFSKFNSFHFSRTRNNSINFTIFLVRNEAGFNMDINILSLDLERQLKTPSSQHQFENSFKTIFTLDSSDFGAKLFRNAIFQLRNWIRMSKTHFKIITNDVQYQFSCYWSSFIVTRSRCESSSTNSLSWPRRSKKFRIFGTGFSILRNVFKKHFDPLQIWYTFCLRILLPKIFAPLFWILWMKFWFIFQRHQFENDL